MAEKGSQKTGLGLKRVVERVAQTLEGGFADLQLHPPRGTIRATSHLALLTGVSEQRRGDGNERKRGTNPL